MNVGMLGHWATKPGLKLFHTLGNQTTQATQVQINRNNSSLLPAKAANQIPQNKRKHFSPAGRDNYCRYHWHVHWNQFWRNKKDRNKVWNNENNTFSDAFFNPKWWCDTIYDVTCNSCNCNSDFLECKVQEKKRAKTINDLSWRFPQNTPKNNNDKNGPASSHEFLLKTNNSANASLGVDFGGYCILQTATGNMRKGGTTNLSHFLAMRWKYRTHFEFQFPSSARMLPKRQTWSIPERAPNRVSQGGTKSSSFLLHFLWNDLFPMQFWGFSNAETSQFVFKCEC